MKIRFILPAVFYSVLFCSCASIPPLATVTSGGKSVDLVFNRDLIKVTGFRNIQRAVLSPDKRYILLVTDPSGHVLFDCGRDAIVKDDAKTVQLLAIKTPWCRETNLHNYYKDLQFTGQVPRYKMDIRRYRQIAFELTDDMARTTSSPDLEGRRGTIDLIELTDNATYKSAEVSSPSIYEWLFGRDKLAILCRNWSGLNPFLKFYSLNELKEVAAIMIVKNEQATDDFLSSMSSDANKSILLFHNGRLIQFYDFGSMKYLGCLLMIDDKNWFAASHTGEYDGSDGALDYFQWDLGKERVPVTGFDRSFRNRGLLADIVGLRKSGGSEASRIDIAGQLIGKVREIKGGEIIVSSGSAAETMKMGDRVFVIIDGRKVLLEVKFPMQTIAKCAVAPASAEFSDRIAAGMPVFK